MCLDHVWDHVEREHYPWNRTARAPSFASLKIRATVHRNFVHVNPALPCLPAPTLGGGLTVSSHLCKVGSDFGRNCAESPWAQLCRRSGHMDWVAFLQIFGITMMLDASLEHHFTSLRQIRLVGCGWKIDLGWVWRLEMVLNQPVSALTKNLFVRYRKLLWLEIGRGFQRTKLCLVWNLSAKAMRVQSFMSR